MKISAAILEGKSCQFVNQISLNLNEFFLKKSNCQIPVSSISFFLTLVTFPNEVPMQQNATSALGTFSAEISENSLMIISSILSNEYPKVFLDTTKILENSFLQKCQEKNKKKNIYLANILPLFQGYNHFSTGLSRCSKH